MIAGGCPHLARTNDGSDPEPLDFERMFEALPVGAMTCDLRTFTIDYANPCSVELLHSIRDELPIDPNDIVGTSIDIFHKAPMHQRALLSDAAQLPHKARIRFGREWLDLHIHPLTDSKGRVTRALLIWAVATAEVAKAEEEYRLQRMIDDMPVAVMTVDPGNFEITYLNEASKRTLNQIENLLPVNASDLLGRSIDIFHRNPAHQRALLANPCNLPHRAQIRLGPEVLDLQVSAVNGTDGAYIGPMLTWSVITKQVAAEARIHQLAHYDTLMGLANRSTFRDRLQDKLQVEDARLALLFIDLDGFKFVNDNYGHLVGDTLLTSVAERLGLCCKAGDLIARLGGDEFAIVMPDAGEEEASELAARIVEAMRSPFDQSGGASLRIGGSIGIAVVPEHGVDLHLIQARADMALYNAKDAGKNTFRLFTPELELRLNDRVRLESKLRHAVEQREGLFLYYQPILNTVTRQITCREALIRFHHPLRGWISPGEFIPIAEESGLIGELGAWVIEQACLDAASWTDGARVAVNVSARQLGNGTLQPTVLAALLKSGLAPDRLEIEVTETALLENELDSLADLRQMRAMGVRIALDDFGTGFSSLAHLRAFPFDKIKIDGSFVRDATTRSDCAAIVGLVAELGTRLGVTTVAEGVETQAHFDLVRAEGCTEVQGYFFGRPVPMERPATQPGEMKTA